MAKCMTTQLSPWPTLALCCVAVSLPAPARAEAGAAQKAAAESLFDDGRKAMKSGHFTEACPKFEESERIDPAIGTLLYLAECYEKTGRTASAWATFREAASAAQAQGETERTRVASARADRLQPSLSKLIVKVVPETAQLPTLRVTRDNLPLAKALFGVAIPVDPGKYHIVASADGYQSYEADLEVLANGDSKSLEIPALAASTTPPPAAPSDAIVTTQPSSSVPPSSPEAAAPVARNGLRTAAYVSGALGVVSLGIGLLLWRESPVQKQRRQGPLLGQGLSRSARRVPDQGRQERRSGIEHHDRFGRRVRRGGGGVVFDECAERKCRELGSAGATPAPGP